MLLSSVLHLPPHTSHTLPLTPPLSSTTTTTTTMTRAKAPETHPNTPFTTENTQTGQPTEKRSSRTTTHKAPTLTNVVLPKPQPVAAEPTTAPSAVPDIEDFYPSDAHSLRSSLLPWYDRNKRDLPWRRPPHHNGRGGGRDEEETHLAYAVWVSEVMLQQTRVSSVVAYYQRWMERWPTVRHLAAATQEEVNEMWAGLGYYRRARFLLEGAKSIVERGHFPRTVSGLREVKGIGDYTAGAIASIAFNEVVQVVDGNVVRVIARLKAISSNPKQSATIKTIWKLAGQLVDPSRPGDFNQALMELGATLCSVTSPSCSKCPISRQCRALALSKSCQSIRITDYPVKVAKPKQRLEFAAVCVVEIVHNRKPMAFGDGNESRVFLLVKRPDEGLLAGLWEFPLVIIDGKNSDQSTRRKVINQYLKKSFSLDLGRNCTAAFRQDVGEYIHIFSHIRLHMYVEFSIIHLKDGLPGPFHETMGKGSITWKYVEEASIKTMGLTSGIRKVYNMIQDFKNKEFSSHPKITSRKRSKNAPQ